MFIVTLANVIQLVTGSTTSCRCQFPVLRDHLSWGITDQTSFYASQLTPHDDVINAQYVSRDVSSVARLLLLGEPVPGHEK